jgi:hypothetical protein
MCAYGNQEALNFLPRIGKIQANIAPNVQHEIIVGDSGAAGEEHAVAAKQPFESEQQVLAEQSNKLNDALYAGQQRPKNFFT